MKTQSQAIGIGLCALALVASVAALGQPVISSFSGNGILVCGNLATGTVATVEWAWSLSGPWNTDWAGLDAVTVGTNGSIQVSVPMFYRVLGVPSGSAPSGMALIPAGAFTMGNSIYDGDITDANPLAVNVSAIYMDVNPVSYSQWLSVYVYAISYGYNFNNTGSGKAANHPVQQVDWYDCVKWCNARSQQAGKTPVYYTDAGMAHVYTNGEVTPFVNWSANGYRLPTEAEWEKAARGGLSGQRFPWGNTISWGRADYYGNPGALGGYAYDLATAADYDPAFSGGDNGAYPYTSPVGSFAPNGYGLYDMAGNVWEWCWDWYGTPYAGGADPRGPASGSSRVLRGGPWNSLAGDCRTARRGYDGPTGHDNGIGFRCVLPAGQ